MWKYFASLFHISFWFNPAPDPLLLWSRRLILILIIALFVAWGGLRLMIELWKRRQAFRDPWNNLKDPERFFGHVSLFLFWSGASGLLIFWFTSQRVPYLSMRIFFFLWIVGMGFWQWMLYRLFVRERAAVEQWKARQAYEKWLPKPKK